MEMCETEKRLRVKEAARLGGVTEECVRHWIRNNPGLAVQEGPRNAYVIPEAKIRRLLNARAELAAARRELAEGGAL